MAPMNDGPYFTPDREGRERSSIQLPLRFRSIRAALQSQPSQNREKHLAAPVSTVDHTPRSQVLFFHYRGKVQTMQVISFFISFLLEFQTFVCFGGLVDSRQYTMMRVMTFRIGSEVFAQETSNKLKNKIKVLAFMI